MIMMNRIIKKQSVIWSVILTAAFLLMSAGLVAAQADASAEPQSEEQAFTAEIPKAPTPIPQEAQKFVYNGHGLRDPFVSLLLKDQIDPSKSGLASMKISELTLQGLQIGLGKVAIVLGTDGKAYNLKIGQNLYDGKVVAIENRKVIFEKVILDPFGREKDKQRIELYLH